jgi:hypothetical protein
LALFSQLFDVLGNFVPGLAFCPKRLHEVFDVLR